MFEGNLIFLNREREIGSSTVWANLFYRQAVFLTVAKIVYIAFCHLIIVCIVFSNDTDKIAQDILKISKMRISFTEANLMILVT